MPPLTGRVVAGRYRIVEPIGRGAMGVVWRASDQLLDRDVAVKEVRLNPALGDVERANAYKRTLREARTAARLSHRGVVTVFDVVEEDGRPFIIMELIRSRSLDEMLATEGRVPARRAGRIAQQLLSALSHAHAAGVLHRDVKPSNVLIATGGYDERAVLTDFGIAQFEGDPRLTQTGMVMGSPGFTAPERIRGGTATPASDLWSLGATIFAACEGKGPYEARGGAITTMSAIINEDAPPAQAAGRLGPVIAALLRRDPARRPTASAAAAMIGEILQALPPDAPVRTPTSLAPARKAAAPPSAPPPVVAPTGVDASSSGREKPGPTPESRTTPPPPPPVARTVAPHEPAGKAAGKPPPGAAPAAKAPVGAAPASTTGTAPPGRHPQAPAGDGPDTAPYDAAEDDDSGPDTAPYDAAEDDASQQDAAAPEAAAQDGAEPSTAPIEAADGTPAAAAAADAPDSPDAAPGDAPPGDPAAGDRGSGDAVPADAAVSGSTPDGPAADSAALDGPAADGAALDGAALSGAALDGAALDGPALDGAAPDRAAADGAARDGATPDDNSAAERALAAEADAEVAEPALAFATSMETTIRSKPSPLPTPQPVAGPVTAAMTRAPRQAPPPPPPPPEKDAWWASAYQPAKTPQAARNPQLDGYAQPPRPPQPGQWPPRLGAISSGTLPQPSFPDDHAPFPEVETTPPRGPRRRGRTALIAVATVVVLGAAAAVATTLLSKHNTNSTPNVVHTSSGTQATQGTPVAATGSVPPFSGTTPPVVKFFDQASGAVPAEFTQETFTPAQTQTKAGFTIAYPTGWQVHQSPGEPQRVFFQDPNSPANVEVDLTAHAKADMLAEAKSIEQYGVTNGQFPNYKQIELDAQNLRGTRGGVWRFDYTGPSGTTMRADDLLFVLQTPNGPQSYAIFAAAPEGANSSNWNNVALPILEKMLSSFETSPAS